jgi:hypothetical protein
MDLLLGDSTSEDEGSDDGNGGCESMAMELCEFDHDV